MSENDLLMAPFTFVGTQDEIIAAIGENERRWGITRYVVRENAINDAETSSRWKTVVAEDGAVASLETT